MQKPINPTVKDSEVPEDFNVPEYFEGRTWKNKKHQKAPMHRVVK